MVKYVFGTSFLRALTFMKRCEPNTRYSPPCSVKSPPTGNIKQKPCPLDLWGPTHDIWAPQRDFWVLGGTFWVLSGSFGVLGRTFGVLGVTFGVLSKTFVVLSCSSVG